MDTKKQAKLTLVGGGPGDPDLITVKGIKALKAADVVLYDALINPELLDYARGAIQIFVGKRNGFKSCSQEKINEMIVSYAREYGHVVRLKGGDPFIFGRGAEEIKYARAFGLEVAIVPGISSALAVPTNLGISLTHREVARSFWVLTGTTSARQLNNDIRIAARSTATIVILMGMRKLEKIVRIFQKENKGKIPVAIIQSGTTIREQTGIGTVDTIVEIAKEENLSSPAIIVIGDVVRESHQLAALYEEITQSEFQSLPLSA